VRRIGRYIIHGLLGRGGMGKVYRVELPPVGKIAALKLLQPDPVLAQLLGQPKLIDQFTTEARTLASLDHPHIVTIHDFDFWEGKPFYVMDYHAHNLGALIGESYRTENPSRILPADRALVYIHQLLEGLAALHDAGIIHRDIKPFNLLVTASDTLKICDFGLSKLRGESFAGPSNLNVGSPFYAAPEQEKDPNRVDQTADLYPVGIMLYRMLTGRLPEAAPGTKKYRPPSRLNPDIDKVWDDFIAQAMATSPAQRFANAQSMLYALTELTRHWQAQKEQTCALPPAETSFAGSGPPRISLRSTPLKLSPRQAATRFDLDVLWRPRTYFKNDFEKQGEEIILDQARGLIWQRQGSNYPVPWEQAIAYTAQLNEMRFTGRRTWRLPTMAELITLLRPSPQVNDLCLPHLFSATQRHLWSSDRRSFVAAYFVEAEMGYVGWSDFSAPHFVRAVCSV
jgi:serine/threonine-protein kinase